MKNLVIFLLGVFLGMFICYGYMWYQVYQKFDYVWTCQVFTGELSIEEKAKCKQQ